MDLNSFSCTGRLTADASYRTLASGKSLLSCSIAVNTGFGDNQKVIFVKLQQWNVKSSAVLQYMKKGTLVGATGELGKQEWTDKEGKLHTDFVVNTFGIQLLSSPRTDNSVNNVAVSKEEFDDDNGNEIPF